MTESQLIVLKDWPYDGVGRRWDLFGFLFIFNCKAVPETFSRLGYCALHTDGCCCSCVPWYFVDHFAKQILFSIESRTDFGDLLFWAKSGAAKFYKSFLSRPRSRRSNIFWATRSEKDVFWTKAADLSFFLSSFASLGKGFLCCLSSRNSNHTKILLPYAAVRVAALPARAALDAEPAQAVPSTELERLFIWPAFILSLVFYLHFYLGLIENGPFLGKLWWGSNERMIFWTFIIVDPSTLRRNSRYIRYSEIRILARNVCLKQKWKSFLINPICLYLKTSSVGRLKD